MSISENFDCVRRQNSLSSNNSSSIAVSSISTASTQVINGENCVFERDPLQLRTYANECQKWSMHAKTKILYELHHLFSNNISPPNCCHQECIKKFTLPEIQQLRYLYCKEKTDRKRVLIAFALEQREQSTEKKFLLFSHYICSIVSFIALEYQNT